MTAKPATETRQKAKQQIAPSPVNAGSIALMEPRMPYSGFVQTEFGLSESGWRTMIDSIYPSARTMDGVIMALTYCKARGLDPFKKPVHVVPVWSSQRKKMVEGVWPGIAEVRTTAARTGVYAGCDETVFGEGFEETFEAEVNEEQEDRTWSKRTIKVTVDYPDWARITVYKIVGAQRCPFPGPKIYFKEIYSRIGKTIIPNDKWQRSPSYMLEKCAEAAALRKAFPEELGDVLTAEEMEGKIIDMDAAPIVAKADPSEDAPPRPTRGDAHHTQTAKAESQPGSHKFEWTDLYGDTTEVEAVKFDGLFMEAIAKTKQTSPLEIMWENNSSQISHLATVRADIIREAYAARLKELTTPVPKPESPIGGMLKLLDAVKTEKAMKTLLATNGESIQELADGPNTQAYADLQMAIDKTWARLRKPVEEGGGQP